MVEAESEVVLLPSFVFASMLHMLMTYAAVRLCGGCCCHCYVCLGRINLCSFGNASLHVWYAAVSVWNSWVSFWLKVKWVAQASHPASFLYTTARRGDFSLHIKACSRCVLAGFRLEGLLEIWHCRSCMNDRSLNAFRHNTVCGSKSVVSKLYHEITKGRGATTS